MNDDDNDDGALQRNSAAALAPNKSPTANTNKHTNKTHATQTKHSLIVSLHHFAANMSRSRRVRIAMGRILTYKCPK